MTTLSAQSIRMRCGVQLLTSFEKEGLYLVDGQPMLDPFFERAVHAETGTSYGLGPCTYDVRIREDIILAPGDFSLASTLERFAMPLNVCATVKDKSSLVRKGLTVQNTHLDPGWQGWLTLELKNVNRESVTANLYSKTTIKLMAGQPIAQIEFKFLDEPTDQPYRGKYTNQGPEATPSLREK